MTKGLVLVHILFITENFQLGYMYITQPVIKWLFCLKSLHNRYGWSAVRNSSSNIFLFDTRGQLFSKARSFKTVEKMLSKDLFTK